MWTDAIEVRRDMTPVMLRKKARSEKDGRVAARLLAIANILSGLDRKASAEAAGMTRQTLRDWVHRFNNEGIDGLRDRPKGHPPRALTAEQEAEIVELVCCPPPDIRLARWRRCDVQAEIERRFGVRLHETCVGKLLHRLGFRRVSVRPMHPESDPEAMTAFKKTSRAVWQRSCRHMQVANASSSGSRMRRASDRKER
jgi:transposase